MTTSRDNTADAIAALLRAGLRHIQGRGNAISETATLDLLIKPTLEALGYPATYRFPEYSWLGNRLDESCFLREVDAEPGQAAIIVEAKQYGVDFDKVPAGQVKDNSPDQQIQRYLKQHKASGPDTFGVLTDGARWRLYRRAKGQSNAASRANPDIEFLTEYNFLPLAHSEPALLPDLLANLQEQLTELVSRLFRENIAYGVKNLFATPPPDNLADGLFEVLAEERNPDAVLRQMLGEPDAVLQSSTASPLTLTGLRLHAHNNSWNSYYYTPGLPLKTENPALFEPKAVVAAVQFRPQEQGRSAPPDVAQTQVEPRPNRKQRDAGLARPDVALAARAFADVDPSRAAVVLAYTDTDGGGMEARLAVAANGQVNMTAAFDPTLAAPSARAAADQLLQLLQQPPAGLTAEQLMLPLEASQLRQQFYREVARWTTAQQQGKDLTQRQTILRHLVRVMFAWILKEENIIPPELFEQAFAHAALPHADDYHREILRFLFHRRLNVLTDKRDEHPNPRINGAMEPVPFLNGSLFAQHPDTDDALDLSAAAYWNTDSTAPGLFTILSRYHWTMDEHRPGESEQTLDPELLSNLFERLITPTVEGTAVPLRQPQGTYYTPADVADEMVKDALAAAVRNYAPAAVSDAQLRELFGSSDAALPELTPQETATLIRRIKELRIFDPAVGSGEFLFSVLTALRRALSNLAPGAANPVADIIRRQLAGQDINPLAVQITRLRLFIAITAAERHNPNPGPLPNLEARIVCADTLATVANPEWRPERPGQLTDALPELATTLAAAAANRAEWFDAHTEEAKQERLTAESRLRAELDSLLQNRRELASPELRGFAQTELYDKNPRPAKTDARLLFYENPWRGFDVVISNPPYEALKESMDKAAVAALKDRKGYQTTNVGDLYSLFCETGLALANPEGGVVTLIVPLSIAFGRQQETLRAVFENRSSVIDLRQYNNNPSMMFHTNPLTKDPRNRQRVTIITTQLGSQSPVVRSTGLQRWPAAERQLCLVQRQTVVQPQYQAGVHRHTARQWARIPTEEVRDMVQSIIHQKKTIASYRASSEVEVALPVAAEYFISCIPAGKYSRTEQLIRVASDDDLRLLMAALNGHVGYAWWWMYGDGFHIKSSDFAALTVPDEWVENPQPAIDLGQRLIDAMPECEVEIVIHGKLWENVDFHQKRGLIEEIDRLHLAALGFTGAAQDKVLDHLRIMRSSSSWRYPA